MLYYVELMFIAAVKVAGCPGPLQFYILYTKGRHRGGMCVSHCIQLLCKFHVSVKVHDSTLVYIVYYNVQLLALIIYKCINYITLNTSNIFIV